MDAPLGGTRVRGVSYAQQRWYEPGTGRFLSEDPLGVTNERLLAPAGLRVFGYGAMNPLRWTDPRGLDAGRQAEHGQQDEIYIRLVERYRETGGHISSEEYYTSFQQPLHRIEWQKEYASQFAMELERNGGDYEFSRNQALFYMNMISRQVDPNVTRTQREMLKSMNVVFSVAVLGVAAEAGTPSVRSPRPTAAPLTDEMLGSARAQARVAPPAPAPPPEPVEYGPFHRLDTAANVARSKMSGYLGGLPARNFFASDTPEAKAFVGPLPEGASGFEFFTPVPPRPGTQPGKALWQDTLPGVRKGTMGEADAAFIPIRITRDSISAPPVAEPQNTSGTTNAGAK